MKTFFKEYWTLIVWTLYCEAVEFLPVNNLTKVLLIAVIWGTITVRNEIKEIDKRIQQRINQIKNECSD